MKTNERVGNESTIWGELIYISRKKSSHQAAKAIKKFKFKGNANGCQWLLI